MENYKMEVIHHDLDCKCHRRREWIEVDGKMTAIEFSVKNPDEPPMSDEQKQKIVELIKQTRKELSQRK
ncbi:TPA: hypothetical protein ACGPSD_001286 [Streptococcus agalactiae]